LKGYKVGFTKESLKNKTKCESNIFTNFVHYSLPFPSIIRADVNQLRFIKPGVVDSIICDPPYGFRAMTRENTGKTIVKPNKENTVSTDSSVDTLNEFIELDINNKEKKDFKDNYDPYECNEVCFKGLKHCDVNVLFERLLDVGANLLKLEGLLVCLYPFKLETEELG
jgi:tRNA G10  N-methylase Trm11